MPFLPIQFTVQVLFVKPPKNQTLQFPSNVIFNIKNALSQFYVQLYVNVSLILLANYGFQGILGNGLYLTYCIVILQ